MTKNERVARASDVQNLLEHIGWTDHIKPHLDTAEADLKARLVQSVLFKEGDEMQIAARIYGLVYINKLFEKILKAGESALADIREEYKKVLAAEQDSTLL